MKTCSHCGRNLPESQFHKNNQTKDGLHNFCRDCRTKLQKEYRQNKLKEKSSIQIPTTDTVSNVTEQKELDSLANISSRSLILELRKRGYTGKLQLVTIKEVVI